MATIRTAIQIQDRMTPAFNSMNNALNIILNTFESVQAASSKSIDTASIQTARNEIANACSALQQAENEIKDVGNGVEDVDNKINTANRSAGSFLNTLMGFSVIQKVIGIVSGQVDSAIQRLDTLNNFPKVMSNLGIGEEQSSAAINYLSENLKGLPTTLNDAASAVQNFTSVNGNVGKSAQMFLALNNAILAGGGSTQVQQSALEQLSQAYAKGKPDMMEWRTAMTAMPAQLKQVAIAMGYVDANALGEDLRAGKVSMTDFMNKFIELNETGANGFQSLEEQARNATGGFETSIANMKSAATRGIASVITSINKGLESAGLPSIQEIIVQTGIAIETMLTNVGLFVENAIMYLQPVINFFQWLGQVISDIWPIISPILLGIIAILAIYFAYTTIVKTATMAWAAAQAILNGILAMNPLVLIIVAIIAIISLIYSAVAAINKITGKTTSATGIIMGIIYGLAAFIYNTFIVPTWNYFAELVNFIANVFHAPVDSVKILFYDLAATVIGYIETMAKGIEDVINKIPGVQVDITSGLRNFKGQLEKAAQEAKDKAEWVEIVGKIDYWDYSDAAAAGYNKGTEIEESIGNMFNFDNMVPKNTADVLDTTTVDSINSTADNTKGIKNSLECTEEDLKYLRDIAEQEVVNRFTTAEIRIDMTNNNNISKDTDLDGIVDYLEETLQETMESVAEGVYV